MFIATLGAFLIGIVAAGAGRRFMENVQRAHRRGITVGLIEFGHHRPDHVGHELVEIGQRWKDPSEVQTLLFSRDEYTPSRAQTWARRHGFRYGTRNMDITENTIRIRQLDPTEFYDFRTVEFKPGLKAVIGPRTP